MPSMAFTAGSATADAKADAVHLVATHGPIVAPGGKLPSSSDAPPRAPPCPAVAGVDVDVDDAGVDVVPVDVDVDVGVPPVPDVGMPAMPAGLPGTSLQAAVAIVAQAQPIVRCLRKVFIGKRS